MGSPAPPRRSGRAGPDRPQRGRGALPGPLRRGRPRPHPPGAGQQLLRPLPGAAQPRSGSLFRREWFAVVDAPPARAERVRYWDKAATQDAGDYTVGVLMAKTDDGLFYVEDVVRGQWSPQARNQVMVQTACLDRERYDNRVRIWVEQGRGAAAGRARRRASGCWRAIRSGTRR